MAEKVWVVDVILRSESEAHAHQLMGIRVYSSSGEGSQERGFAECLI